MSSVAFGKLPICRSSEGSKVKQEIGISFLGKLYITRRTVTQETQ